MDAGKRTAAATEFKEFLSAIRATAWPATPNSICASWD
jgi:hypothetical protein